MHSCLLETKQSVANKFARRSFLLRISSDPNCSLTLCLEDLTDDTLAGEDIASILNTDDVVTLQCIGMVDVDEDVVFASEVGDVDVDADESWSKLI